MSISFVMATRNAAAFVQDALQSIDNAVGAGIPIEILAADANSTDETVALLNADSRVRLVSTSDSGIYDGMNRAIRAASNDFVMILNSDDLLPVGAINSAIAALVAEPSRAWISGEAMFRIAGGSGVIRRNKRPLSIEGAMFGIPAINARIFRRAVLAKIGPIRTDLGLASDREWMVRLAKSQEKGLAFPAPVYIYRIHQGSSTIAGDKPSRGRVYNAERQLAKGFLSEPTTCRHVVDLARRMDALAAIKQSFAGKTNPSRLGLWETTAALGLAQRWRGVLSGY